MMVHVVEIDDGLLVDGELDMDAADDFLDIAEARVDGAREVVLDIADLGFIDSAGVRAILQLAATSCRTAWCCIGRGRASSVSSTSGRSRRSQAFACSGATPRIRLVNPAHDPKQEDSRCWLIQSEEDKAARAVAFGLLREMERK
jgi:ABC-type transporter Mla MlaB component